MKEIHILQLDFKKINKQSEIVESSEILQDQLKKEINTMLYLIRSLRSGLFRKESELKAKIAKESTPELQDTLVEQLQSELQTSCQNLEFALYNLDTSDS